MNQVYPKVRSNGRQTDPFGDQRRLASTRWFRQPSKWLCLLIAYYPIHITVYKLITPNLPSVASPLLSMWEVLIICGLFAVGLVRTLHGFPLRPILLDYVIAGWLCTAFTSAIYSPDTPLIIWGFRMTYMPALLYFAIRFLPFPRLSDYRYLTDFILKICLFLAASGIILDLLVPTPMLSVWYERMDAVLSYYQDMLRMGSLFYSPVVFGSLMALASILCFALLFSKGRASILNRYLLGLFLFSFCCIMSLARGAWIAEMVGITIIVFARRKRRLGKFAIAAWLVMVLVVAQLVYFGNTSALVNHIRTIYEAPEVGTGQLARAEQFEKGWEDFVKNPLGHGLGNSGHVATWFQDPLKPEEHVIVSDNWYLKVLQESGILGFILFVAFVVTFMICSYRWYRVSLPGYHEDLTLGVGAAFVGFNLEAYGSNTWDFYMVGAVYWILLGLVTNLSQVSRERPALASELLPRAISVAGSKRSSR